MSDPLILRSEDRERGDIARWTAPTITPGVVARRIAEQPSAADVARILEQAREEGYAAGLAEGRKTGEQQVHGEVRELSQRVTTLLHALAEPLRSVEADVERQLVELVLAVSRQVVHLELALKPEHIVAAVHEAVAALPRSDEAPVQIQLHPQDIALLEDLLAQDAGERPLWQLREDSSVRRGGCRVRRGYAEVDARLQTRLEQVFGQLRAELEPVEQLAEAVQPDGESRP